VRQKAHPFVLAVHRVSRVFPRSETYGLSSPFRRVAELRPLLEEVSKLLDAYLRAILDSDS
jgi:hypothetical protein